MQPKTLGLLWDIVDAFRNRLIHGYDVIDNALVWQIIERRLPLLIAEAEALLAEDGHYRLPSIARWCAILYRM